MSEIKEIVDLFDCSWSDAIIIEKCANITKEIFDDTVAKFCADCYKARRFKTVRGLRRARGRLDERDDELRTVIWTKEAGCCSLCRENNGYYANLTKKNRARLEKVKKKYGFGEYGFFDIDKKECKLPRYLRSQTCLFHTCSKLKRELSPKLVQILDNIEIIMQGIKLQSKGVY